MLPGLDRLSPRRRLAALAVLGAVLAALIGGFAGYLARPGPVAAVAAVRQDQPGPVLLVPGYGGGTGSLQPLAARLRATGRAVTVLELPGDGTGDLRVQARGLADAVRAARSGGAPSVDVVGYSAGGVVARLWARYDGGAAQARRVVTLGSPHHGTSLAALAGSLLPDACREACRQLAPDSELLRALDAGDETPDGPQWLSLWTTTDETVTPPSSAQLRGAVDVPLQSVCASSTATHGSLPQDPLVIALTVRALGVAPVRLPAPGSCADLLAIGGR